MSSGGLPISCGRIFYCILLKMGKGRHSHVFSSPLVYYYLMISRRMQWIIWSRHGNGCVFGGESALQETQSGGVKTAGRCTWADNMQIFLTVNSEPVRDRNFMQGHIEG